MSSFGERLQREREMRNITLHEIAESTKISTRNLRALEEEHFDQLPGGIFNKGFVRSYARYLGINEEQAVSDYLSAFAELEASRNPIVVMPLANGNGVAHAENVIAIRASAAEEAAESDTAETDPAYNFLRAAVVLLVLLGLSGGAMKYFSEHRASAANQSAAQPLQASAAPAVVAQKSVQQDVPVTQLPRTSSASLPKVEAAPPSAAPDSSLLATAKAAEPSPAAQTPASATSIARIPELTADAGKRFTLMVRARDASWIQVTSEGKVLMEGMLMPDTERAFHNAKQLVVKLGNPGAVELSYNGKALPPFPPDNKTRTVTFTAQGPKPE